MLPLGDLRAEVTLMARWNLGSLQRRAVLAAVVRREAARLPADLLDELYERLVATSRARCRLAPRTLRGRGDRPADLYPIALVLIESISSYRFMIETFGRAPDDLDDERFIAGWVDATMAVAARYGIS